MRCYACDSRMKKVRIRSSFVGPRRRRFLMLALIIGLAATGLLLSEYGWIRVLGQIGRYGFSPIYRAITFATLRKTAMARNSIQEDEIGVYLLSLPRAVERRDVAIRQLDGVLNVTVIDAIDGSRDLFNEKDLEDFIGHSRMEAAGLYSTECRLALASCPGEFKTERSRIAIDLTYVNLFRNLLSSPFKAIVVLEDDAVLTTTGAEFKHTLASALSKTPRDWDLLMLFSFPGVSVFGPTVDQGIKILYSGVGTAGFVITPAMASYLLRVSRWLMPALLIDLMMCGFLVETSLINAYVTDPFLVQHGSFPTTKWTLQPDY